MADTRITGWRKIVGILLLVLVSVSFVFLGLSYYIQSMVGGGESCGHSRGASHSCAYFSASLAARAAGESSHCAGRSKINNATAGVGIDDATMAFKKSDKSSSLCDFQIISCVNRCNKCRFFCSKVIFPASVLPRWRRRMAESELGLLELIREDLRVQQWQQQIGGYDIHGAGTDAKCLSALLSAAFVWLFFNRPQKPWSRRKSHHRKRFHNIIGSIKQPIGCLRVCKSIMCACNRHRLKKNW